MRKFATDSGRATCSCTSLRRMKRGGALDGLFHQTSKTSLATTVTFPRQKTASYEMHSPQPSTFVTESHAEKPLISPHLPMIPGSWMEAPVQFAREMRPRVQFYSANNATASITWGA